MWVFVFFLAFLVLLHLVVVVLIDGGVIGGVDIVAFVGGQW